MLVKELFIRKELKLKQKHTPLKAIRKRCIDCSGFELKAVRDCPFDGKQEEECQLYTLRMGKGSRACLRRIRKYCLWCCSDQAYEVRLCPAVECPLWVYRFGKRPKRVLFSEIASTERFLGAVETKDMQRARLPRG